MQTKRDFYLQQLVDGKQNGLIKKSSEFHKSSDDFYMANHQIKAMLTQAALAAVKFNPFMARYNMRLVERGKKKQVALNNIKNKLVHLVTAMVRNRQTFTPEYKISA